jgi:hypothetical protein
VTTVTPLEPKEAKPIEGVSPEVLERYRVAVVYHRKQDWDAARTEIDEVLRQAPTGLQRSTCSRASSSTPATRMQPSPRGSDRSPRIRCSRRSVWRARRGAASARRSREGRRSSTRAVEMGDVDASYYLAAMAWEDNEPFEAKAHLDRFLGSSTPDHLLRPLAQARSTSRSSAASSR